MVRAREINLANRLRARLLVHQSEVRDLPGIYDPSHRKVLIEQFIESMRRIKYVSTVMERPISPRRTDPNDPIFDPLKASILFRREEHIDEAFWMVFMFVHFGKHRRYGWEYARRVYGQLGSSSRWDWANTSADPSGFTYWLADNVDKVRNSGGPGGFGNHRKYERLDPFAIRGTGAAFRTYVEWVRPPRTHRELVGEALDRNGGDPKATFDDLYLTMNLVATFGRTARFDYLTMLSKVGLAPIIPGKPYLQDATGPRKGASLLFGADPGPAQLDQWTADLGSSLDVDMQVMEDALCNWQKSPNYFVTFRG